MARDQRRNEPPDWSELRRRAEAEAGSDSGEADAEIRRLLHELQVHQIELEMQNAELRQARAEAESSLERYADLYDFAPVGYLTLDRAGVVQQANLAAAELLGQDRSQLIGRRFKTFLAGPFQKELEGFLDAAFSRTGRQSEEFALQVGAQTERFVQIEACVAKTSEECRATMLDITERRRADNELRIAASVYETIKEGVMITDADNRMIAVNAAFTRLTGYTAEEALGQNPRLIQSGCHAPAFFHAMWQSLLATGHWEGEIIDRHKNGEEFLAWLSIDTLNDAQGRPIRRIGLLADLCEERSAAAAIWQQANYDLLTGLPNRRLFQDRLQQEIDKMQRAGRELALLFIDLDHFKEINDTLGHEAGDLLLGDAARRICDLVRKTDTVARLGGDEFTVIMSDLLATERVAEVARAIIEALSQPFQIETEKAYLSASIGIAVYPTDGATMADLLKGADQAMYAAKGDGRRRFRFFTSEMQAATLVRSSLINELRAALADEQFEVHFQPIVELATGRIEIAEALVRWNHPTRGLVYPGDFIAAAEESGLINEIGEWVFRESSRWVESRQRQSGAPFQVCVHESPAQLLVDPKHQSRLEWLKRKGISGESIVIEITERLFLSERPAAVEKLSRFRQAGIGLAIDDFAIGHSALSYMQKADIDYLKIDRAFISGLTTDPADRALIEAIIVMAHKLGIQVIAEGVETEEERALLLAAGCDYAQGYLFARPASVGEITW